MSTRRVLDRLFMTSLIVVGIAGAAQACVLQPTQRETRQLSAKEDAAEIAHAFFQLRRVQRGDEARTRTRETIAAERRESVVPPARRP